MRTRAVSRLTLTAVVGIGAFALTACGTANEPDDDGEITVVTTTSVYADVVKEVAGDNVTVEAIIDSAAQDPHSYEATPQDRLTVGDADLVVLNGGGYDAFMEDLAQESEVAVVEAVEVSGLEDSEHTEEAAAEESATDGDSHDDDNGHEGHDHGSFNEHVWYDPASMGKVAQAVAEQLGSVDADNAQSYTDRADDFQEQTAALSQRANGLDLSGDYVATEPVADHLLEAAGLHNVTPTAFTVAVEDGTDAAPLVHEEVRELVTGDDVDLLVYNEQTSTGQSQDLRTTARNADLPVLAVSETLPDGQNYLDWMGENIDRLETAVGSQGS